jgi:nicotinic acid mononucleotide adenylyltransferase
LLWIMGADLAAQTGRWASFGEVERLSTVVWFNRQGYPTIPRGGPPLPDVSATEVRANARSVEGLRGLVPAAVGRYIEERNLYGA